MCDDCRCESQCAAMHTAGWWDRWCLRADPRPLLLLAILLMTASFWVCKSPAVAMIAEKHYVAIGLSLILLYVFAWVRVFQERWRNFYEERYLIPTGAYRSRRWFLPWLLVIAGATFFMLVHELPIYVSFQLSCSALDRIADEALADPTNLHLLAGRRAGLYRVEKVEAIGGTVVLYIDQSEGTYGFARVPGVRNDVIHNWGNKDDPNYHQDFPEPKYPGDLEGQRIAGDWYLVYIPRGEGCWSQLNRANRGLLKLSKPTSVIMPSLSSLTS